MTNATLNKTDVLAADLSPVMTALEAGYRMIQKAYPDAPDVTIIIKRDERAWGHTTVAKVWADKSADAGHRYEIMISGENLRRGAVSVVGTLLHEAAHARNLAAGVRGTDVNGRHNLKFKETAEEMGLAITELGWHGWSHTEVPELAQKRWAKLIARIQTGLDRAVVAAPRPTVVPVPPATPGAPTPGLAPTEPPRRTGNRNLLKAVCACGHSIRLSRTVLEVAKPTCTECGKPFELA